MARESDRSWIDAPPFQVQKLVERLLLLGGTASAGNGRPAWLAALFVLLRELRSGHLALAEETRQWLFDRATESEDPLLLAEVDRIVGGGANPSLRETYRRLWGNHCVQVALDVHDLGRALAVACAVAEAGVDLIEIGDPLIKSQGIGAVRAVKEQVPMAWVVAEMMSADWGRDQVELAVEAGADVVLLIGPASASSVAAAVRAARRLDAPLVLDVPAAHATHEWIKDMEQCGVDGFTITTNIDLGVGGRGAIETAADVRAWTRLPLAVSGGFGASDHLLARDRTWDITIIGRGVSDAVDPREAARQALETLDGKSPTRAGQAP